MLRGSPVMQVLARKVFTTHLARAGLNVTPRDGIQDSAPRRIRTVIIA